MSSNTPLTDSINNLTTYANSVTGASDTNLSDAVATLASGYGGGGGISLDDVADGSIPDGALVLPQAQNIAKYAFAHRTKITSVQAPECLSINEYAFFGCNNMLSISFPKLTTFSGTYAFSECTKIGNVVFPSLTGELKTRTFNNCSALTIADLGSCSQISNQAFNGTTSVRTLILRKSSVCTLQAWNAITLGGIYNNPTASTIYVPSALISSYKSANNWSTAFSAGLTFSAIEGSQYENYYADGTPIASS